MSAACAFSLASQPSVSFQTTQSYGGVLPASAPVFTGAASDVAFEQSVFVGSNLVTPSLLTESLSLLPTSPSVIALNNGGHSAPQQVQSTYIVDITNPASLGPKIFFTVPVHDLPLTSAAVATFVSPSNAYAQLAQLVSVNIDNVGGIVGMDVYAYTFDGVNFPVGLYRYIIKIIN